MNPKIKMIEEIITTLQKIEIERLSTIDFFRFEEVLDLLRDLHTVCHDESPMEP